MYLKMIALQTVLIWSLLFSPHGNINVNLCSNPSDESIDWNDIYNVDERKLIAQIPEANIVLYYLKIDKDYGRYEGFILQVNDIKKLLNWNNVINPSFGPQLTLSDLDKDGEEELVIQLCQGHGTGVYDEEVHVFNPPFYDEILIEDPIIVLYKNTRAREFPEHFEIILKHKKYKVYKKGKLTPPYEKVGVGWGHHNTTYEVKNNTLYSRTRVGADVINIGEVILRYKYQDEILQMDNIDFISY